MKRVIVESPYAGEVARNVDYARACVRDSVLRGEAPIASHLLFTQPGILKDAIPHEREMDIAAGLAWRSVADYSVFYVDRGWSKGMLASVNSAAQQQLPFRIRSLHPDRSFSKTSAVLLANTPLTIGHITNAIMADELCQ